MESCFRGIRPGRVRTVEQIGLGGRAQEKPCVGKGASQKGESAGRSGGAADLIKKSPGHLGHERGRLIPLEMKQMAMVLINEAVQAGARQSKACAVLGLTCRTLRRWRAAESLIDRR